MQWAGAPLLWCVGSIVWHMDCCSTACGIFPDQGSNLCLLHWQADSLTSDPPRKPCWIIFEGKLIVFSREFEIWFETWGKGLGQAEDLGALYIWDGASLVAQLVKNLPTVKETEVRFPGREGPLEKEMATGSSILAWRIAWTEEPGGLQSMGCNSRTQLSD